MKSQAKYHHSGEGTAGTSRHAETLPIRHEGSQDKQFLGAFRLGEKEASLQAFIWNQLLISMWWRLLRLQSINHSRF
jgi:hypothetical protein